MKTSLLCAAIRIALFAPPTAANVLSLSYHRAGRPLPSP